MRIKKLIIKLGVILLLFGSVACKNKNTELEKKIANLEKQNAELAKRQQEQQNLASIKTNEIKKEKKAEIPSKPKKISNYEGKLENRISNYEAKRDKISDENGWSVEETQANEALNEKLDDELTKVYNLIMERLPEGKKVNFRNEQRQWLKTRKRKVENSNNDEDGNSMMGGRAAGNVEIMTYQEFTKDRLFEFARIYDNMD
ncbi:lysozyme inhibitor LprI family protein [Leptotrichia wadei]|uniref:lysozyme inhibitor LprI family protein n=1 Tax=Leptotrichia wadei TaxID=157687 RepID=UPI0028EE4E7B|nr:lysozyme inhibitor LprI family protein [Leptotrichia wadei]